MSEALTQVDDLPPEPPAPVAVEPEPLAVTPDAPVVPPDPDEAQSVEIQGGKHVPLAALKASREEGKAAKEEAARLRTETEQLKGALATFQHLQRQQPAAPAAPAAPTADDPELRELAHSLSFWKPDGTLDLDQAAKFRDLTNRQATKIAREMVRPMQAETENQRAAANFERSLSFKAPNGKQPSREAVQLVYQGIPANLAANPDVANMLSLLAVGIDATKGGQLPAAPPPPANPPVHTDGGGRVARPAGAISNVERAVIESRGMSEKTYAEHTKDFKPGRMNVLED